MKLPLSPKELLRATEQLSAHSAPVSDEEGSAEYHCEGVFVSDLHLGNPGFQAPEFLQFIKSVGTDQLIIDGDMVDFLDLYHYSYFPQDHLTVVQKLLRLARKGTRIIYVPGNHDKRLRELAAEALRDGDTFRLGDNIVLVPLHLLIIGELQVLILHGDEFDGKSKFSQFWAWLGSHGYDKMMWLGRRINRVLRLLGLKERQFAAWCKSWVNGLIRSYSKNFNEAVAAVAESYNVDIVIYGHVHIPSDTMISCGGKSVRVINLGSWVEPPPMGCTALVQDKDGILALVQWRDGKLYRFPSGEEIPPGEIRFSTMATDVSYA